MACKKGRDVIAFTNLRVLVMDVQCWLGNGCFSFIAFRNTWANSAESACNYNRDSETDWYSCNMWVVSNVQLDFRKGKADILLIQM
jgi:hypothetical protein